MIYVPSETLTALETVLDYYWQEEERHYEETPEDDRHDHIFTSLKIMQAFVISDDTVAVHPISDHPDETNFRIVEVKP